MRTPRTHTLGALSVGLLLVLTACSGGGDPAPNESSTGGATTTTSSPTSAQSPSADTSPSASAEPGEPGDATESADALNPDGDGEVSWAFPIDAEGWDASIVNEEGVNQITNAEGCLFGSSVNPVEAQSGTSDREATEALAQEYLYSFDPSQNPQHEESTGTVPAGADREPMDVLRLDTTFEDETGTEFTSVMLMRVLDQDGAWVSLDFTCPTSAYDPAELDALVDETTLTGVEPSAF